MAKANYKIPFDKDGNQLHYPENTWCDGKLESPVWRNNEIFEDVLEFETYSRGRSAAYFNFKRANGCGVTVFMTDMCDMIPRMIEGHIVGKFTFTKRGQNYGCKLV